jgi:pimeloyl-ACP methyl ester carboxylesterase
MPVRAIFRTVKVEGKSASFDTIFLKIFYPALAPQNDTERNSGILAPDAQHAPFPCVIFLNGVNCPPESYQWLAQSLCEKGFIFVSFQWITDELPGGMQGLTPGIDVRFMTFENYGKGTTGSAIQPILDDLEKVNSNGLLENCLDLENIALGGHSAGGSIALMNAEYFPQIKKAFVYGAHTQGSMIMGFPPDYVCPITSEKPILILGGNNDGVITWSARRYGKSDEDSTVSLKQTFDKAIGGNRNDRFLAIFDGANHFTFANPKDSTTGRPFLDFEPKNDAENRKIMAEMIADFLNGKDLEKFANNENIAIFERK